MKAWKLSNLILSGLALGGLGAAIWRALYAVGTDSKGLLPRFHPLAVLLIVLVAAALALFIAQAVPRKDLGPGPAGPSLPGAFGAFLSAAGIGLTVLLVSPQTPGYAAVAWRILGALATVGLAFTGYRHIQGRTPPFAAYLAVSLFYIFHIVDHYRGWSGNPQLLDFAFSLLACVALALFAYYCAAHSVGLGSGRMRLVTGLSVIFFGIVALSAGAYFVLYASAILWVVTTLLIPQHPAPEAPKEAPNEAA